MSDENDVSNRQLVSLRGDNVLVLGPRHTMTKREALVHAAWLVALADDDGNFNVILEKVQSS